MIGKRFFPGSNLSIRQLAPWQCYLGAVLLVILSTLINIPFHSRISPTNLAMLYLVAVIISAAYLGRGPAILASILGVLAFDYIFVPPILTLRVFDTEYLITFAVLLAVGLIISELTLQVRSQAEAAERRERDTSALYDLSRDLAAAEGIEPVISALTRHIHRTVDHDSALILQEDSGELKLEESLQGNGFNLTQEEQIAVNTAFQNQQSTGQGFPIAAIPLCASQGIIGLLVLKPVDPTDQLKPEQMKLLETFANQAALAIERVRLADRANQLQVMQETERLQTALFNSISHDLRTPLVSIMGSLSTLKDDGFALDKELRDNLVENAYQEASRLNRLVGNLLNMTRLEAGAIKVVRRPEDIQDVIGASLEQLNERLGKRPITVEVDAENISVPVDFVLIVQVLVNLIDNAARYSAEGSPIEIKASIRENRMQVMVADRGIGIPAEDLERVFTKFYRVKRPQHVPGTGLGLSICKGIIDAHNGDIRADHRPGGGTIITISLPLELSEGR